MLKDEIEKVIEQSKLTGVSIAGGYMPHSPWKSLTDRDLAAGLERVSGWKISPEAIRQLWRNKNG